LVAPTFIPSSPTNVHDSTTTENSPPISSTPTSTPIQPVSPSATSLEPSQLEFASLQSVPSVQPPALDDLSTSSTAIQHVSPPIEPSHQMITRSRTGSLKPKQFPDFQMLYSTKHPLKAFTSISPHIPCEPTSFSKAVQNQDWRDAMTIEVDALMKNHTWTLCPRPSHKRVLRNRWVYKLKQKSDGSIERYKARLVVKGFEQQGGIDYTETFSLVIKPATIRLVLAVSVYYNWMLCQLDVSNTSLHGFLEEEVFMEQPQGFVDSSKPDYVCKLHKSLYGLKQAPRAWFHRLSNVLLDLGFVGSTVDTSLFIFHQHSVHILFLIYVDDIIVTSNQPMAIFALIV
jgi:hypothetical protein